jgi:hypothetical protein
MKTLLELVNEADGNIYFSVTVNPELLHIISKIIEDAGYTYTVEGNVVSVTPQNASERLNAFQDMIYNKLGDMFEEGDQELIKFVGSSEMGDFIDADLGISVEAYKK